MRRITAITLVTAACILLATTAWARVGPPVTVKYLGDPRIAEQGREYPGQLLITAEKPSTITGLRFESEGWNAIAINAPDTKTMAAGEQLVIDFTAWPSDSDKPIIFAFEYGGVTVEKRLDFSEANYNRTLRPDPARRIQDPMYDPNHRSELSADDTTVELNQAVDSRSIINVHGRFGYYREDGSYHPAQAMRIYVYDQDSGDDDLLGTGFTDHDGYYEINVESGDSGETYPDLYVRFETWNYRIETKDPTYENIYAWATGVQNNFSGSEWDVGSLVPSSDTNQPAVHLHTNGSRVHWFLNLRAGYDTPAVNVLWPDGTSGAWYNGAGVHISTERQWREDTLSHEYGHHWETSFSSIEPFDYCNGICDFGGNCGHCLWCEESDVIAWLEGFANFMADEFTRFLDDYYPIAPLYFRSFESLATCDGTNYGDPELTEGYAAAVLRDISDVVSAADDHPQYPGWGDALGAGITGILTVVDYDNPNGPSDFLDKHIARYPNLRNYLWETAMNCGYNRDGAAPGNVTNLTSPSHSTTGDSPDPTIDYTWTTAYDDVSGIEGYGIFLAGWVGMPSAELDIGAVNSYTTETLAPGTYYLNIRAMDRDGNWSSTYASYGPVVIRDPDPVDLAFIELPNWDYYAFPSQGTDNSASEAHVTPVLEGNIGSNHLNIYGRNTGEVALPTGFCVMAAIDDQSMLTPCWGAIGPGGGFIAYDWGNYSVRGGRHTFHAELDTYEEIAESNETNNIFGRQFVWTGLPLSPFAPVVRNAPPGSTDGWENSGGILWYNTDGLSFQSTGWWNAVAVHSVDPADDYDIRLHEGSTGSENGFGSNVGWSARPAGRLDVVLVNRNLAGSNPYDVGVLNHDEGMSNYVAEHVTSAEYTFGDSLDVSLGQDDYLGIMEFWITADDTGRVTVTVATDPADPPLYAAWMDRSFETGTLDMAMAQGSTGSEGFVRFDMHLQVTGYYALVLYRDPSDGGAPVGATVEVQPTPADLEPYWAAGWYSPLVPRPDQDGTPTSVPIPEILHGNVVDTWLNVAATNSGYLPVTSARNEIRLDGVYFGGLTYTVLNPGAISRFNYTFPLEVRGGRHVLSMHMDPEEVVEEISETNNLYGRQWVWSPLVVPMNSIIGRNAPPDATAGWTEGFGSWYNCDGLRMPDDDFHWWQGAAVMPITSTGNVDVRLHLPSEGATSGFAANLAASLWSAGQSDFVLVNHNMAIVQPYDVGVLDVYDQGGAYGAEMVGSDFLSVTPGGSYGPYSIENGQILRMHEVNLSPGTYTFRLDNESGSVDWGLSLHPGDLEFLTKSDVVPDGMSLSSGPGQTEQITFDIVDGGYYLLAVWKTGVSDLHLTGSYTLRFLDDVSAVGDEGIPTVTRLTQASPNPFNPMTTISYELAAASRVELVIYDVTGARVRRLVSESMAAGVHEAVWDGSDHAGRRVASGTYMARLTADGKPVGLTKLVLVK